MVLMAIFNDKTVLINHHGVKLAEYPASQVSFCGMCTDNKQFFGLVTTRVIEDDDEDDVEDDDDNDQNKESFSSSCHVFMTESVVNEEEISRRSAAFQFEATKLNDNEYKEFPAVANPIIETIMTLYKKVFNEDDDEVEANLYENIVQNGGGLPSPPGSSNSDSGIGYKDTAEQLLQQQQQPQGAAQQQQLPQEVDEDEDDSFNTERLESQNSADNLRQSMQRYLANKHQHLKKASELLVTNRPTEFRQSLMASGQELPTSQPPPRPPPIEEISKSLENLDSNNPTEQQFSAKNKIDPITKLFYNSEGNLSSKKPLPLEAIESYDFISEKLNNEVAFMTKMPQQPLKPQTLSAEPKTQGIMQCNFYTFIV